MLHPRSLIENLNICEQKDQLSRIKDDEKVLVEQEQRTKNTKKKM
jgi:hypothetical protein